jgi:hypothetical protein
MGKWGEAQPKGLVESGRLDILLTINARHHCHAKGKKRKQTHFTLLPMKVHANSDIT